MGSLSISTSTSTVHVHVQNLPCTYPACMQEVAILHLTACRAQPPMALNHIDFGRQNAASVLDLEPCSSLLSHSALMWLHPTIYFPQLTCAFPLLEGDARGSARLPHPPSGNLRILPVHHRPPSRHYPVTRHSYQWGVPNY